MRQQKRMDFGGGSDPAAFLLLAVQGLAARFGVLAERVDLDSIETELQTLSQSLDAISATAAGLGLLDHQPAAANRAMVARASRRGNSGRAWTPEQRATYEATIAAKRHAAQAEHEASGAAGWTPARRLAQAKRMGQVNQQRTAPAKKPLSAKQRAALVAHAAKMREIKAAKQAERTKATGTKATSWTPERRAAHAATMREHAKRVWTPERRAAASKKMRAVAKRGWATRRKNAAKSS